jgi:hypothetical protein
MRPFTKQAAEVRTRDPEMAIDSEETSTRASRPIKPPNPPDMGRHFCLSIYKMLQVCNFDNAPIAKNAGYSLQGLAGVWDKKNKKKCGSSDWQALADFRLWLTLPGLWHTIRAQLSRGPRP